MLLSRDNKDCRQRNISQTHRLRLKNSDAYSLCSSCDDQPDHITVSGKHKKEAEDPSGGVKLNGDSVLLVLFVVMLLEEYCFDMIENIHLFSFSFYLNYKINKHTEYVSKSYSMIFILHTSHTNIGVRFTLKQFSFRNF